MRAAPAALPAAQADPLAILLPGRQIRDELEAECPARAEGVVDRGQCGRKVTFPHQRLQDPVRGNHRTERPQGEGQITYIAPNQFQTACQFIARDPPARSCQHRLRPVDAYDLTARLSERDGDPSRAASELEDRAGSLERQPPPERNVTPAQRSRVFPVIEGRVLVPSLVAFSHY